MLLGVAGGGIKSIKPLQRLASSPGPRWLVAVTSTRQISNVGLLRHRDQPSPAQQHISKLRPAQLCSEHRDDGPGVELETKIREDFLA